MHQKRKVDFRTGKILGIKDHIVTWTKPKSCPSGLDKALFAILPQSMMVRNDYYVHLLAYNLIRILMFQSGKEY